MRKLWEHIKMVQERFDEYLKMEWKDLKSGDMEDETKSFQKDLTKMKGIDKKTNVYNGINKEIRNWLIFLPLISEMKNPAMTVEGDRHWEAIRENCKLDFHVEDDTTLSLFWDHGIYDLKIREEIEEVTERARNERKIENNLKMVAEKWEAIKFLRVPLELKSETIETIKMDDEEVEVLEEHQLLVQNIAASKFMGYFKETVEYWRDGLSAISETVSLMSEVQKTWSFLINLFIYSEEVKKELKNYADHFVQIDKEVKELLEN